MRARRLGAEILVAALFLAACGDGGETTAPESPDTTTTATDETSTTGVDDGDSAGPTVLEFEAATVAGGQLAGGDLVGQDLALWFWAPW